MTHRLYRSCQPLGMVFSAGGDGGRKSPEHFSALGGPLRLALAPLCLPQPAWRGFFVQERDELATLHSTTSSARPEQHWRQCPQIFDPRCRGRQSPSDSSPDIRSRSRRCIGTFPMAVILHDLLLFSCLREATSRAERLTKSLALGLAPVPASARLCWYSPVLWL